MAWRKFTVATDNHGAEQDDHAVRAFFAFTEHYQPQERIHAGDNWNFGSIRKGASADEQRDSMLGDYHKGLEFLSRYNPTKLTLGNHCQRLWDQAQDGTGPVADLAHVWTENIQRTLTKMRCEWVPYDKRRYLPVGKGTSWIVQHGIAHGESASKKMAQVYSTAGNVMYGHIHQLQSFTIPGIQTRTAQSCGCLCKLSQRYNRSHAGTLAQQNGWIYGVWNDRTGELLHWQARQMSDGRFILPTGIESF